mmetsp:Transcript_49141/g.106966  ORF Transcript_49141/g.106966 Transcript_49141/m.106966 type:complete len:210 (+) Transcript_49141:219-848(+)
MSTASSWLPLPDHEPAAGKVTCRLPRAGEASLGESDGPLRCRSGVGGPSEGVAELAWEPRGGCDEPAAPWRCAPPRALGSAVSSDQAPGLRLACRCSCLRSLRPPILFVTPVRSMKACRRSLWTAGRLGRAQILALASSRCSARYFRMPKRTAWTERPFTTMMAATTCRRLKKESRAAMARSRSSSVCRVSRMASKESFALQRNTAKKK